MSNRSRVFWIAPLALTVAALALAARLARGDEPPSRPKLVQRVYAVADLVVPISDSAPLPPLGRPVGATAASQSACTATPCPTAPCPVGAPSRLGVGVNTDAGLSGSVLFNKCSDAPIACGPKPATPLAQTREKELLRLITNTIAPSTWSDFGGPGTIDYMPIGMALVVKQPAEIQEQIADLLKALRRLQDNQVAFEARLIAVIGDHVLQQAGFCPNACPSPDRPMILSDAQVHQFLQAVQGDRRASVLQAPKLTVFNGQRASFRCADEQYFVTNVAPVACNGQTVHVPQNVPITLGFQMAVRPTVAPDGKSIHCEVAAEHAVLATPVVPLHPVTTFLTPVFEGGAQGQPIPFTQFLQQPAIARRHVEKALDIPAGCSALLYAGKREKEDDSEPEVPAPPPLFCWLPALMELFAPEAPRPMITEHLYLLVTPRVLKSEPTAERLPMPRCVPAAAEEQTAPPPMPPTPAAVSDCPLTGCCQLQRVQMTPNGAITVPACPPGGCCLQSGVVAERQIQFDITVASVDPTFFDHPIGAVWADLSPKSCGTKPQFLSASEANRFANTMRSQKAAKLLAQPKIITMNGQPASFLCGGEQQCVTGVSLTERDGTFVPEFQSTTRPFGVQLQMLPVVSADGRSVTLALSSEISALVKTVEYRVTVAPADERSKEAPRTETLRRPVMNVQQVETKVSVPLPDRAVLLYFGKDHDGRNLALIITPRLIEPANVMVAPPPAPRSPALTPVVCPLPSASPLAVRATLCPTCAVPVVAPLPAAPPMPTFAPVALSAAPPLPPTAIFFRYLGPGAEEQVAPPPQLPTAANPKLAKLLAMYRAACAAGDTAGAQTLALRCLAIDPTCFGK